MALQFEVLKTEGAARRGVMTDLKLILQTVAVVFTGKGAA